MSSLAVVDFLITGAKQISNERLGFSLWSMWTLSGMANKSQVGRSFWLKDSHCFRHSLQSVPSCLCSTQPAEALVDWPGLVLLHPPHLSIYESIMPQVTMWPCKKPALNPFFSNAQLSLTPTLHQKSPRFRSIPEAVKQGAPKFFLTLDAPSCAHRSRLVRQEVKSVENTVNLVDFQNNVQCSAVFYFELKTWRFDLRKIITKPFKT